MHLFGAKLGFALHFEEFRERIPDNGGVQSFYFTNVSAAKGEMPHGIIDVLPDRRTLRQGVQHVGDQFSWSCARTDERRHSAFYATFNQSFAILAVSALDRSEYLEAHPEHRIWKPGDFKQS